jgi:hypothetical protein
MVTETVLEADARRESTTIRVNVNVPLAVGVPLITPLPNTSSPGGRDPDVDQL